MTKIKINNNLIKTEIIIKNNYIDKYLKKTLKKNKKVFCIVDIKVKYLIKKFENNKKINIIFLKSGENIKNYQTYNQICEKLLSKNINRESILISIGGGTLGDLSGFIASTILRGVEFKLIPTTLLSQVDSSIGGKNGINTKSGKNLIGTFYNPNEVLIDTNVLKTLPKREIKAGYAEIIKHSLIKDYKFFKWLENNYEKLLNLDINILEKAVYKSIMIKLWYVKRDPKENLINNNSRAMLNFGHTIGHAIEAFYNFSKNLNHGEAISIGMSTEAIISNRLGFLKDSHLEKILIHFRNAKLKIYDKNLKKSRIIEFILKDKKNIDNHVNIVLINKIGNSFFCRNIKINQIKKIIKNI